MSWVGLSAFFPFQILCSIQNTQLQELETIKMPEKTRFRQLTLACKFPIEFGSRFQVRLQQNFQFDH